MALREVVADWVVNTNAPKVLGDIDESIKNTNKSTEKLHETSKEFFHDSDEKLLRLNRKFGKLKDVVHSNVRTLTQVDKAFQVIAGSVIVDRLSSLGGAVLDAGATIETYRTILETALGSTAEAADEMARLKEFSDLTPFTVNQVTDSFVKMVNRGLQPGNEALTAMGDVAASQGKPLEQLTEAILDISNSERWREFGIESTRNGDKVSLAFKGMTLTGDATVQSVASMIEEFGRMEGVAGGMAKLSKTWNGLMSTLEGVTQTTFGLFGEVMIETFKPMVELGIDLLQRFNKWLGDSEKGAQRTRIVLTVLSVVVGSVLVAALHTAAVAAWSFLSPILALAAPILAITSAVVVLFLVFEDLFTFLTGGESIIGDILEPVLGWFQDFGTMIDETLGKVKAFFSFIDQAGIDIESKVLSFFGFETSAPEPMNIEARAGGGDIQSGNPYLVGEKGPEIIVPKNSGTVIPNNKIGATQKSFTLNVGGITINVGNAREAVPVLKAELRRLIDELADSEMRAEAGLI